MYSAWYIDEDGKGRVSNFATNRPFGFDDPIDGWELIQQVMNSEQRPKLMWLKEIDDADLGQFDHYPANRDQLHERNGNRQQVQQKKRRRKKKRPGKTVPASQSQS